MSMRGASRRAAGALPVSVSAFAWDAVTIASLRHCTLPWSETFDLHLAVPGVPLASAASELGSRDRLSLLAQFVAHEGFLAFAGVADRDVDISEWVVVRKRGSDCRLVRIASRPADSESAPPVIALAQHFADAIGGVTLDGLRRPWVRTETIYAEIDERLRQDAVADRRWMRRAATGQILAPGPESLREIWYSQQRNCSFKDATIVDALSALQRLDSSSSLIIAGGTVALQRYGALTSFGDGIAGCDRSEAEVAQVIAAALAARRHVVVIDAPEMLDVSSRRVIDSVMTLAPATWLRRVAHDASLPPQRLFVVSPRLASMEPLCARAQTLASPFEWLEQFVLSDQYGTYLATGQLPADHSVFATTAEPKRSYIAALALLGTTVEQSLATRFLHDVLFDQPLDQLVVDGLTALTGDQFSFASDDIREMCAQHIPAASRPALFRAAAALTTGEQSALLLIECGDVAEGMASLERVRWPDAPAAVRTLSRLPPASLTPALRELLANALYECGRYAEAREAASMLEPETREFLLARVERRAGDYRTALNRLERMNLRSFGADLLRAELYRLCRRYNDAFVTLSAASPLTVEDEIALTYERAVLSIDRGIEPSLPSIPVTHYLGARLATYEALDRGDYPRAAAMAAQAAALARTTLERIDAWLDRVFASFSSGQWVETRAMTIEALTIIDETHGDRAAAGILYTHAYLAADDARWESAAFLVDRLRAHFSAASDVERTFELKLLTAHIAFGRGLFDEAYRDATAVLERPENVKQIREAAALIVDEIEWIRKNRVPLRSTGRSGNRELDERHRFLAAGGNAELPEPSTRSEKLRLFRWAIRNSAEDIAATIAAELDLERRTSSNESLAGDAVILRVAAALDYPFPRDAFGVSWCFATRNRLGHWAADGCQSFSQSELDHLFAEPSGDWLRCGDRELLYLEGSRGWPAAHRRAVGALFRSKAELDRLRRLMAATENDAVVERIDATHGIIGESPAIRAIFEVIDRVARRDVAVCVLGESGTGKELVARAIHRASPRSRKAFTAINCAALPENLIESELFGHVRGAFTGADRDRAGLIETSDGGTVFLDEIGEMPVTAQAKLLRFLQDGDFRRVGDATSRTADVRIVSATNRKLENAVEEGRFREDLYYRIRGVELALPPLRERGTDVLLLARHFLAAERAHHRTGPVALSSETEMLFRVYRWPGNVRELQNTIRAAHAIAGDMREVESQHLPDRLRNAAPDRPAAGSYQEAVARFRRDLIEKSLLAASGNQNRAAAMLNMSRQALAYQIRELGILVRGADATRV